jgi:cytochrome b561
VLAIANHLLFYVVLIGLPLTGWAAISTGAAAQESATTTLVGGIPFPFIPGLPQSAHEFYEGGHELLVKTTYALVVLHIGAALKHQFIDKSPIANRMPPFHVRGGGQT